jgi:hypothetical protein
MLFATPLFGLPLIGVWLTNDIVSAYLEFPPKTSPHHTEPFSWGVFLLMVLVVTLSVAPFVVRVLHFRTTRRQACAIRRFPWWGWFGLAGLIIAWILAWNRFPWFANWQAFTFPPLWLAYVIVINAFTYQRTGRCMMLDQTTQFFLLFPLSAAFWWSYEYLNRFVENWYYVEISDFGPWEYFIYSTLSFSTVLPAVLGTAQWLKSFSRLSSGLDNFWRTGATHQTALAWLILVTGCAGLSVIAVWPDYVYPLIWIAPLLLITGLHGIIDHHQTPLLTALVTGNWQTVWVLALAALVCGVLWELWNFNSQAHWVYTVPYIQRFHLFEMPLLGYAGYLPFGITCGAITNFVMSDRAHHTLS